MYEELVIFYLFISVTLETHKIKMIEDSDCSDAILICKIIRGFAVSG